MSGTNTGTSSSAVTDANIARFDTGLLTNKWVLILTGNRAGESRRITSTSSTTSTLVTALSGALANGDTFEILSYDPGVYNDAIGEATRTLQQANERHRHPRLYLPLRPRVYL